MARIIVDNKLAARLEQADGLVELCDEAGNVLGRVYPKDDLSKWEPVSPGISEKELRRRFDSDEPSYTTAEVLARLEKLDQERKCRPCCATMEKNLAWTCHQHTDPHECPDCIVQYFPSQKKYGILIHDGGSSFVRIEFCPWCGFRLRPQDA